MTIRILRQKCPAWALGALSGALSLALVACGQSAQPSAPAASEAGSAAQGQSDGKRLVLAVKGEPEQGFDPIKGWGEYGNPLFQSTLIRRDENLNLVGDLATKWELSDDRLTWTVSLRDDVKFADGQPLTAEDVAFTFETGRQAASGLDLSMLEEAKATDAKTVQFRLKKPQVTFVQKLATVGIVPKHAYAENYGEAPMGSGPYKFVSWSKGQQLIVEPNPNYYGHMPQFERITFLFTKEDATMAAARSGQVHVAAVPAALSEDVPANMNRVPVKTVDNRGIVFPMQPAQGKKSEAGHDIGNDVTSDIAIRKAVNIAINRQQLVDGVLGGHGTPAWGIVDGLPWDNPEQRLPDNDMPAAQEMLKQAGWVKNDKGVLEKNGKEARIPLLYFSDDTVRQALGLAVADMVKPLGIVFEVTGKTREEVMRLKHTSAVLYGWGSHSPDEVYKVYAGSLAGKGHYNTGFYNNATVNAYLDAAEGAPSLEASYPYWQKAMWDGKTGYGMKGDAVWAWLVNLDHVYLVDKCLDIGPRQVEPHGHGFSVTWNVQDWKWTCQ